MTTETNAERLRSIQEKVKWGTLDTIDFTWLIQQAERAEELEASNNRCVQVARSRKKHIDHIESENEEITDILVKMRDSFTEKDEQAEGHGMEDAVACPIAVAQYAFNKYERTLNENARLREALEFYAGNGHYELWQERDGTPLTNEWTNDVTYDGGVTARTALNIQEDSQ